MSEYADFSEKITANPELAAELEKILKANNVTAEELLSGFSDDTIRELFSFAKKTGFDVTFAEIMAFANEAALSDDELEAIAGGSKTKAAFCILMLVLASKSRMS